MRPLTMMDKVPFNIPDGYLDVFFLFLAPLWKDKKWNELTEIQILTYLVTKIIKMEVIVFQPYEQ